MLFFDVRLSKREDRSCAGCHDPKREFADGRTLPVGSDARPITRHVPTLWNLAWSSRFFWDGRAATLEEQVLEPIRTEMGLPWGELVGRLSSDPNLSARFAEGFPADPRTTVENVAAALATYLRTLVSPRNRFDAWVEGDESALSPGERRGFAIFTGKAGCSRCHAGWAFTDNRFHDTGIADDADPGRGAVDGPALAHAFKTPTLRGVRWSQPFMHNGRIAKLGYVVEHYEHNFVPRPTLSSEMATFALSEDERDDLVSFLRAIGDHDGDRAGAPTSP
jgi:cytochrome c peroxidase